MIVRKTLSLRLIYEFSGHHLLWLTVWMLLVTAVYQFTHWHFITLPWLPLSVTGTAVAFYVGFKNNQAYDRIWEARKIWGTMVNNSRKLAATIKTFRSDESNPGNGADIRKQIVFRHIAYLYQLRGQLLKPTPWEHVSLKWIFGSYNRRRRETLMTSFKDELDEVAMRKYLSDEERLELKGFNNTAAQLLDKQTAMVQSLYEMKAITAMQQISLQDILNSFFDEQGKAERIKNFPLPRKYASFSFVFVCIFVFLLPFGIVGEFSKLGAAFVWLSVPVGVIVGWIYVVMELIGDYSENPFEGLHNDIPMLSLCRTIEIDMLQMIGEKDIPKPIQSKDNILL